MNSHRRPVGRARILAATGAAVMLVGAVLRWWMVGGDNGLPEISGNAFDGMGIVVFVVALVTIAIVTLPYATDRPVAADQWLAYAILAAVGWLAFVIRVVDLATIGALSIPEPTAIFTNGPGLWVTGVGLAMLGRAAYDINRAPGVR